jgi:hypothetical protein
LRGDGRLGRLGVLKVIDEGRCLRPGEFAGGLALRESHWTAGIAEVSVAGVVKEVQELPDLLGRSRWSRLLTKGHSPKSAA